MKSLSILVLALLASSSGGSLSPADQGQHLCIPRPERTTPRGLYERHDKWQRDQRAIA